MWAITELFLLYCFILRISITEAGTIRYCIPNKVIRNNTGLGKACANLHIDQHAIECVATTDRLACFQLLLTGKVDFMVAEPEDLRAMRAYNESNVFVTHQLKMFAEPLPQSSVEMIALVKSDFDKNWTTRGKKLCYSGLGISRTNQFDYHYEPYFESWLFPRSCDSHKTTLENRIASLADYFESACIAGPWSFDHDIDTKLKSKYRKLCELCSDPYTCSEWDRYYGMSGALTCLRQGLGNVAWLSRVEAIKYFSQLASLGFTLLCPDGTFASLTGPSSNTTCTWIIDPRPVIVANGAVADLVLDKVIDRNEGAEFYKVIHSSYKFSHLQKLKKIEKIEDYLLKFPGYFGASIKTQTICRPERSIRWCVFSNLEARKCKSLQRASEALKISPYFNCIVMQSKNDTIQAVLSEKCDIFVAEPSEVQRIKKLGLKSIIEMVPNKRDEANTVAAIVKKNSTFETYTDLRGAKACFTGYKSIGWDSFIMVLRNGSTEWNCSEISIVSTFFKESCISGLDEIRDGFPKNLYSLCNNRNSELGTEENTFKCLMDGADVAFVNVSAAKAYSSHSAVFNAEYKLLCTTNDQHEKKHSCYLAKVTLGSVLAHGNISQVKEEDIYQMFLMLDRYFGRTFDRETPMFQMYESYEAESNVLFPIATMKLIRSEAGIRYSKYTGDDEYSEISCQVLNSGVDHTARKSNEPELHVTVLFTIFNVLCSYHFHKIHI